MIIKSTLYKNLEIKTNNKKVRTKIYKTRKNILLNGKYIRIKFKFKFKAKFQVFLYFQCIE